MVKKSPKTMKGKERKFASNDGRIKTDLEKGLEKIRGALFPKKKK